eukprot:661429-Hanusia_phi.AAC.1
MWTGAEMIVALQVRTSWGEEEEEGRKRRRRGKLTFVAGYSLLALALPRQFALHVPLLHGSSCAQRAAAGQKPLQ